MTTTYTIPVVLQSIVDYIDALGRTDLDTVTRSYIPKEAVETLPIDKLVVVVFPVADSTSMINRTNAKVDRIFNISFKARVPKETELATIDQFVETVDEIRTEMVKSLVEGTSLLPSGMSLMNVTIEPVYDFDTLSEKSEFLSMIALRTAEETSVR